MLVLTSANAIRHTITSYSAHLPIRTLQRYAALIETEPIAWLYILQPGDTSEALARTRQQPFRRWEFIDCEDQWFEAVFVISDEGFGHVVLVPDQPDIDPDLIDVCRAHADKAGSEKAIEY